ncbi:MAG TPA: hypothetical protein VMI53_10310 [Opitutaceae bacterium]|nr:hypothetical protein [Opitutaceae bacterium]
MAATPPATIWFGAYGGKTSVYLDLAAGAAWSAALSAGAAGWLSFDGASSGTGPALLTLTAPPSTAGRRSARLTVRPAGAGAPLVWPVEQISTAPLSTLNASVLAVPFPTVPTVMEFGIAGKFIAGEIQKIPEPFDLIALVIVELVVLVAGLVAIALRQAVSVIVPEPRTWFGAPEPYDSLTLVLPATAVFLAEETALLAIYIAREVLTGGE